MSVPFPLRRIVLALALALPALPALAEIRVTDITGREVVLEAPAQRLILGEARHLAVLALLAENPVALVAGWRQDKAMDPPTLDAYRSRFPAIDAITPVGAGNHDISAETVIALQPDLVVLSLMDHADAGMERAREQIEAAGIPVVYVDFFSHPLENSIPSLRILGTLTGTGDRAEDFAAFYDSRLQRIRDRLADPSIPRPRVFFHAHAAPGDCCATVGGGVFADFIQTAGGRNIGAEVVDAVLGKVSLEFVIAADPDFYIATGGRHMAARGGLVLGTGIGREEAQASFDALVAEPGLASLRAVESGHADGVWHLFNDTPAHIALIEHLAKTFHPEIFADLDPQATLDEIDRRFLPVSVPGTWWIGAEP